MSFMLRGYWVIGLYNYTGCSHDWWPHCCRGYARVWIKWGGSVSRGRISQVSSFCPLFHSKTMVATNASLNCGRHSSVVSSAPTILRPRVRIPSTPSMLFQFVIDFWCEKDKNKWKRGGDWPMFKKTHPLMLTAIIIQNSLQIQKQSNSPIWVF